MAKYSREPVSEREATEPAVTGEDTSRILAESIRRLRTSQKMTQSDLASRASLSTSFISQLERGSSDITFSTLTRLCAALGTTVGHLFPASRPTGKVVRLDDCKHLDYNGVDKYVLTREEMVDIDVCLFDFPPGSSTGTRVPPGIRRTELWVCSSEYLGIDIGSEVRILKSGDSFSFSSDRTNTVYNPGPLPSRAILIIKNHRNQESK